MGAYFFNPSDEKLRLALGSKLAVGSIKVVPFATRNPPKDSVAAVVKPYFIDLRHSKFSLMCGKWRARP